MKWHVARLALPVDAAIAVCSGTLGLGLVLAWWDQPTPSIQTAQSIQVLTSLLLLGRRRYPIMVMLTCLALSFVTPTPAVVFALHAVGRYVADRHRSTACLVGTVLLTGPLWMISPRVGGFSGAALFAAIAVAPWFAGRAERASIELAAMDIVTTHRARDHAADEARHTERERLAREMHDVVAHRISLIVLQANLLDTVGDDEAVRAATDRIRTTGRAALDEMREVLGLLSRAEVTGEPGPQGDLTRHSLADLQRLVDDARQVGQPVTLEVSAVGRPVPDQAERTVYRIVRESLTNAVRHAPHAATSVRVRHSEGALHVEVVNEPPGAVPTGLTTGGNGIRGLRERVRLVGGTITAGPTPAGGFEVAAVIPRGAS